MECVSKQWGKRDFWGVGFEYDPQWVLTAKQKELQGQLIELCRTKLRPNAIRSDQTAEYPRKNMNALASLGLLGLLVPEELGGLGESHTCAAMVVESIARYGCPSTAMVYVMHLGACATMLFRSHNNPTAKDVLSRLDKDRLIGTLVYSDPATGGHFWYPLSSKCRQTEAGNYQTVKFGSWATSAGFADWYAVQVASPGFKGDYSNLTNFLFFKNEIRANTDDWSALGLRGNQSGPLVAEALLSPDRMIGPIGDGSVSNDEVVDPFFLLLSSCCWNGISMGCVDLAKKHVTSKGHADVGLRVCDYPTIQDYFGESVSDTNSARLMAFCLATGMDQATNKCDWSMHEDDPGVMPRFGFLHWLWQMKFEAAKNVASATDVMLRACGGSGFKTDLGLERLIRDGKAGWVMGPSNEVLRQFVGKTVLLGMDILDYWSQKVDERSLNTELKKLSRAQKSDLVERLAYELKLEEGQDDEKASDTAKNDIYFDDPFNTAPARIPDGVTGVSVAISPNKDSPLTLKKIVPFTSDGKVVKMTFDFPAEVRHLGTFPGQYVEIRMPVNGDTVGRFISPTSVPEDSENLEIVVRYENQGYLAGFLASLKAGQKVNFRGPCGGFEYEPNTLNHVICLCSGIGVTPGIQIVRAVTKNKSDKTHVTLLFQATDREHLLFKSELDVLTSDPRIKVIYTLQDPDGEWTGPTGVMGVAFLKEHLKASLEGSKVLICGGTAMATSCLEGLYRLKYKSDQIFIYGPFGAELVRAVYGRGAKLTTQMA